MAMPVSDKNELDAARDATRKQDTIAEKFRKRYPFSYVTPHPGKIGPHAYDEAYNPDFLFAYLPKYPAEGAATWYFETMVDHQKFVADYLAHEDK